MRPAQEVTSGAQEIKVKVEASTVVSTYWARPKPATAPKATRTAEERILRMDVFEGLKRIWVMTNECEGDDQGIEVFQRRGLGSRLFCSLRGE